MVTKQPNGKKLNPHNPNRTDHETLLPQWESKSMFSPHAGREDNSPNLDFYWFGGLTNSQLGLTIIWNSVFLSLIIQPTYLLQYTYVCK